jgi:hypothetical protein
MLFTQLLDDLGTGSRSVVESHSADRLLESFDYFLWKTVWVGRECASKDDSTNHQDCPLKRTAPAQTPPWRRMHEPTRTFLSIRRTMMLVQCPGNGWTTRLLVAPASCRQMPPGPAPSGPGRDGGPTLSTQLVDTTLARMTLASIHTSARYAACAYVRRPTQIV